MTDKAEARKPTAADRVFADLMDKISAGVWAVDERLPSEDELAESYGVNRLTVRVALQKLNALGVVETRPGSGTRVVEFDYVGYLHTGSKFFSGDGTERSVAEFRNHIELECARLACERATDEEIEVLGRLAQEHRDIWLDSEDLGYGQWCRRVTEADLAFHEEVVRLAHNPFYVCAFAAAREPLFTYLEGNVRKWLPELVKRFRMDRRRDIHFCIYESIKRRDFAECQSNYAAMLSSYARADSATPTVG